MLNKLKSDIQDSEESTERKRSNSQRKYQKAPDIITQVKPNSFIQPPNPHQSAFTPTNRSYKLNPQKLLLPPKPHNLTKKTLILDLDETLVHSSFTPFEKNDIVLNVDFEGVMYNIYVLVRPDAELFIKTVAKFFELVIFTASISKYASPLLDILDKEKNIKHRLYRDQCTFINGIYIKDLKKCNRSLKDLIIVDNSPIAYTFDSDNGLPIKTWIEDPEDNELMKLVPILEFLSKTKDVRKFIDQFVYNNKILYDEALEIIKMKELIDMQNNNKNKIDNGVNTNEDKKNNEFDLDNNFVHNLRLLNKDNFNFDDDSEIKEEKEEKKIKEEKEEKEEKNINKKPEIEVNERNDINLNDFNQKGFNTTKNCIKFSNTNLNFNENNINIKENNTNINNTNIEINISNNKININKQNNNLKQNKKNIFRFKATDQQVPTKIGLNNIIYSNKFDPSLPLTLLLSNISKGLFTPKASSQEKAKKEKNNKSKNNKKSEKTNLNNIKPFLLKDIISEKTNNNKKIKYVNLLDKFKGKNKPQNSSIKNTIKGININKKMKGNYSMKNIIHKPHNLRVSSSINSYQGYLPGSKTNNSIKEKAGTSYYKVTKSKSTDNFLVYNTNKNYPKTPKEQYRKKVAMNNKKMKNFMESINFAKTSNNANSKKINYSKNDFGGIFNKKKNKTIKK